MDTYRNTARHQIERGGRMFAPGQVVDGVDPKNDEDKVLIDHGLVTKVEKVVTDKNADEKPSAPKGGKTTSKQETGSTEAGSSQGKESTE